MQLQYDLNIIIIIIIIIKKGNRFIFFLPLQRYR